MRKLFRDASRFLAGLGIVAALIAASANRAEAQCVPNTYGVICKSVSEQSNAAVADAVAGLLASVDLDEFPSGRLRETWHDGMRIDGPGGGTTGAFTVTEASAFGAKSINVPQDAGNLKLGLFTGYSRLNADFGPSGKAAIDAYFIGGSGTYTRGSSYISYAFTSVIGDVDISGPTRASYDLFGVASNLSGGYIFDLGKIQAMGNSPLKLNLKGGLFYKDLRGDQFSNGGTPESSGLNGWNGAISAKLYSEIRKSPDEVMRPYVSIGLNEQLSYDNYVYSGVWKYNYQQDSALGLGEIGLDYGLSGFTLNGAVYGEIAQDRSTVGAKFGIKYLLN